MEAAAEESEHPVQTVTLTERTPNDITPEIYPFIKDFENKNIQDQQCHLQAVDSALQMAVSKRLGHEY